MSLGTMTFGSDWGWGADIAEAARIFDLYVDRGGNFIDTSVNYTNGAAERFLGEFIGDKRERLVVATKFTMARDPGNPNSGGNHRLNMMRSVEQSLRQLGTDRIDLLYPHAWDMTTRPDEAMRGLDDLVRSGKVLYLGICNTSAWRIAEMQTLAELRGWSPFVALQIEYSLVERTVEHELMPMAAAHGLGVLPGRSWAAAYWPANIPGRMCGSLARRPCLPLARASSPLRGISTSARSRSRTRFAPSPAKSARRRPGSRWHGRWQTPRWCRRSSAPAPSLRPRTISALEVVLSPEQFDRLNRVSAADPIFPARFVERPLVQQLIFGGASVARRA